MKFCSYLVVIGMCCISSGCGSFDGRHNQSALSPNSNIAGQELDANSGSLDPAKNVVYYDARLLGIDGRGWDQTKCFTYYDRLPKYAQSKVSKSVWELSQNSTASMCVDFFTDSDSIYVRYKLRSSELALEHMPAGGVSGMDIYTYDNNKWTLLGATSQIKYPVTDTVIAENLDPGNRRYRIYLPLYNSVESFEIGIKKDSTIAGVPLRYVPGSKPIVFYGTSIVQGGCASRPSMCHANILGRRLGMEVINLGFSGSALMEPEISDLLCELDGSVYILDALPNMSPDYVKDRLVPFVKKLKEAHPDTPIVLVESIDLQNMAYVKNRRDSIIGRNEYLKVGYNDLVKSGIKGLYYVSRAQAKGGDDESTVDTVHPSDMGFVRLSDALEPVIRKAIGESRK